MLAMAEHFFSQEINEKYLKLMISSTSCEDNAKIKIGTGARLGMTAHTRTLWEYIETF